MEKRKSFLGTLKKILDYSLTSNTVGFTILAVFIIAFGIVGFIISKQEPIALTENEIEYYISQAETGYLKGLYYLDDNIELIPINESKFEVYSSTQPKEKQKLRVTFSASTISNKELYYSIDFIRNRVLRTSCGALIGCMLWLLFLFLMEYVSSRIQPSTKCDCPLNFSDKDE